MFLYPITVDRDFLVVKISPIKFLCVTIETASTLTLNSVPQDSEENLNIVTVITLLLLLMILVDNAILIFKTKRQMTFVQTRISEHDL